MSFKGGESKFREKKETKSDGKIEERAVARGIPNIRRDREVILPDQNSNENTNEDECRNASF